MFHLKVLTPENIYFDGFVSSVKVPGKSGDFQILTNHAAIISILRKGRIILIDEDKTEKTFAISGGFLEGHANEISVLADSIDNV